MFRRNVIANFLGRAWPNLLTFLFIPIYIRYLGVEAYGLIGFFTSLQAILAFLDMGLSTTANREMAIQNESSEASTEARDFLRTLEVVYGIIAVLIAALFLLSADWLAAHWLLAEEMPHQTIKLAAIIFGITLALRWPLALYGGVLLGLEKQVLYNIISAITSTLRSAGAVFIIVFLSPTIVAFLLWLFVSALIEFLIMVYATWRVLPKTKSSVRTKFDPNILAKIWRFSASLSLNTIIATILKQTDRILLSGLVPLQSLGYYSTAYSAYTGMGVLQIPVSEASFPRFSSLIAENKLEELADVYHKASQYMSFITAPVASIVFYFSYDILLFWTKSGEVAENAALPLSLLALAYGLNAVMQLPWRLQLAYGITRFMITFNSIALLILLPVMYLLIKSYGVNGAGIGWVLFNVGYYFIIPQWMHKTILPQHKWRWFFYDTLFFIISSWLIFGIAFSVNYIWQHIGLTLLVLLLALISYLTLCYRMYPAIRFSLQGFLATFMKAVRSSKD